MNAKNILKCFFALCAVCVSISLVVFAAAPAVTFVDPTPANNANVSANSVAVKATTTGNTIALDWNKSLAGWWRFNAESGESVTLFKDWSTYGNNASCSGTNCPAAVAGKFGKALQFDGVDDYADMGTITAANVREELTVSGWFNLADNENRWAVSKWKSADAGPSLFALMPSYGGVNPKRPCFYVSDGVATKAVCAKEQMSAGQWFHLAGVYKRGVLKIYINGRLNNAVSGIFTSLNQNVGMPLMLGQASTKTNGGIYKGLMDDIRIYSRALDDKEIFAGYNAAANQLEAVFSGLAAGSYVFNAYAQDGSGAVGAAGQRTVAIGAGCTNQCAANAKQCNGNAVQTCAFSGGCLKWSAAVACASGQTCLSGSCADPVCNNNGTCEGIENEANCFADCAGYCVSPEVKNIISSVWELRKPLFISDIITRLNAKDTYPLYDIQVYTNNLLEYSFYCKDYETLDELSDVYLKAFGYLTLCVDGYKKWIYDNPTGPAARGEENIIISSQYAYLLSNTINIITKIDQDERTAKMNELAQKYVSILVNDHYGRWADVYSPSFTNKLNTKNGFITDADMWMTAGAVEILSANKKNSVLVPMTSAAKTKLTNFANLGTRLIKSRMTETNLTNFSGSSVKGAGFDFGAWTGYPDYDYAGYEGRSFPTTSNKKSVINVGWDISHARRFVQVFSSLYENKAITGETFPSESVMKGLAYQFVYKVFNRDFQKPLFKNFMDGSNGWYRVGYSGRVGFAYPPYGMGISFMTAGYSFWAKYDPEMNKISSSLWGMLKAVWNNSDQSMVDFARNNYVSEVYGDYTRNTDLVALQNKYNRTSSVDLLQFLPSLATKSWTQTTCANECYAIGAKQCNGTTGFKTCGNYDADSCLEWSAATNCSTGQSCSGAGVCAVTCTPTCTTANAKQCSGNGVQTCALSGGYLKWGTAVACPAGQSCSGAGRCAMPDPNCITRASKKCDSGNLYWYNSCGVKGELAEDCGSNTSIGNYRCSSNWIQKETIAKGCSNNACTSASAWANDTDCAASGKVCSSGTCIIRSTSGGGGSGGGSSDGGGGAINPPVDNLPIKPVGQMTRAQILAKINEIVTLISQLQKQLREMTGGRNVYSCTQITSVLYYGTVNDSQVKCLQEVLRAQGYAVTASGNYDIATKTAVAQFQQKYASEILAPYGLRYGSGNAGNATIKKLNDVMAK